MTWSRTPAPVTPSGVLRLSPPASGGAFARSPGAGLGKARWACSHRSLDAPAGTPALPAPMHRYVSPTTNKPCNACGPGTIGPVPSNCRLLDPMETTVFSGVGDSSAAVLVLGFESADHPLNGMDAPCAGTGEQPRWQLRRRIGQKRSMRDEVARNTAAAQPVRGPQFLRMPCKRPGCGQWSHHADTFETATTWNNFGPSTRVCAGCGQAVQHATGHPAFVSCRFTHLPGWSAPTTIDQTRAALMV